MHVKNILQDKFLRQIRKILDLKRRKRDNKHHSLIRKGSKRRSTVERQYPENEKNVTLIRKGSTHNSAIDRQYPEKNDWKFLKSKL